MPTAQRRHLIEVCTPGGERYPVAVQRIKSYDLARRVAHAVACFLARRDDGLNGAPPFCEELRLLLEEACVNAPNCVVEVVEVMGKRRRVVENWPVGIIAAEMHA
jgi:hypothetical protein